MIIRFPDLFLCTAKRFIRIFPGSFDTENERFVFDETLFLNFFKLFLTEKSSKKLEKTEILGESGEKNQKKFEKGVDKRGWI